MLEVLALCVALERLYHSLVGATSEGTNDAFTSAPKYIIPFTEGPGAERGSGAGGRVACHSFLRFPGKRPVRVS